MSANNKPHIPENYKGYKGLPVIAGITSMKDAIEKGLTADESIERLKYFHWSLTRLHKIFVARLTSEPIYELKMAFSLHSHICIEHVGSIFDRVREMRHPPYGMDVAPHKALDLLFDEIIAAPTTEELILGVYEVVIPQLLKAVKRQMEDINMLFEHPTHRMLRFLAIELEELVSYGQKAIECLITPKHRSGNMTWLRTLQTCIEACGGLDGLAPKSDDLPEAIYSQKPYQYDGSPKRDERFNDPYNMGVNAEAFLGDKAQGALPKTLMMYFKRMREIDVPEMMASIIYETEGKPYAYYKDMTRQLWDEARHAMMGEVGFVSLNVDWRKIPFNFTWSLELNNKLTPLERHSILFFIEQGLMPAATGKQMEWEVAIDSGDPVSKLVQDYDWADEVLHAKVGRDWFVKEYGTQPDALKYGEDNWNKILAGDWGSYDKIGLTENKSWWSEVYTDACVHWGIQPDEKVLSYSEDYRDITPEIYTQKV